MLQHVIPGALLFCLRSTLIVWHSGGICKENFCDRSEVMRTALLLVRRGTVVCVQCLGALSVHGCYRRHCLDEKGERHDGWIAQGHCAVCNKYPALIPEFIKPHKHYKAEVIEKVVGEVESGNNVEVSGSCTADISTMRRWSRGFARRGEQTVGCPTSGQPTIQAHTDPHILRDMPILQQPDRLPCEYPAAGGGVIGSPNIILTTQNCGFL